ncbi:hypothetical protein [Acidaminococcus massiliensis]|uniref:hypothetical protein n=1 Tax=Acidaminococcus massiliensis TaxID=1852375 RepID=UPI00248E7617|nr:hypothetical protein [Acidaminococcus massiliensis]
MEKNLLDVLKSRIDTKVGTITALDFAVKAFKSANSESKAPFSLDGNRLIIITNFANISCELINPADDVKDSSNAQAIFKTITASTEKMYETLPSDALVINNSKTLLLKNAQVVPFACPQQTLNYEVLAIFTDQIVGVTIGNFKRNSN